ncbi:kinesin-like protein KIN-14I [Citrus sinensis]|nr:kinesin-like protein KIN-14I [Citrus sinensis]
MCFAVSSVGLMEPTCFNGCDWAGSLFSLNYVVHAGIVIEEMTTEQVLTFNVASVVADVLQKHGPRFSDINLASRKADEASLRRYEAAGWLRKSVGVVVGKDLPAQPSEEEFRLGLRSGIILCNVLNKVQPGAVAKVVEGPCDSVVIPDGAALSAFQYFENVRNFLVAAEELGLPTFEASDLEQGGKSAMARIVNCVLALKSYSEWKQGGEKGPWKYAGNLKPSICVSGKPFMRKTSEPFMNSFSRTSSGGEKSLDGVCSEQALNGDLGHDLNEAGNLRNINVLVRAALSDKKPEEIPIIKTTPKTIQIFGPNNSLTSSSGGIEEVECPINKKTEEGAATETKGKKHANLMSAHNEESKTRLLKQQMLIELQQRDIVELKQTLHTTKAGMQFLQVKYMEDLDTLGNQLHGLAHAASSYQKVLEENRKLYNQVQDLKGNIRVYCRVRPFLDGQSSFMSTVEHIEKGDIVITTPSKYGKEGRKSFSFNKVFGPNATQAEVFSDTRSLIRSVLDGYNVCIFAYGQTGSGKTFTMVREAAHYDCDDNVYDCEIRNSSQNRINVPDANLVPVSSTNDVIEMMNLGQKNRAVGATAMNDRSSRSHSCLTVHVQGRDLASGTILRGSMHLVDLAGSERVDKSEVTGDRLKEAQHINKSLSALGDVIASLAQKNAHVPYRNSKLTQLLQDSLGGQAKTLMFVHISPELEALGETISTLKFAERVATVELGAARVNKDSSDVKELKEQIVSLKAALARKDGDLEHLQYTSSSTPERSALKSGGSSPSKSSCHSLGDFSSNRRQPMEEVGNIQIRNLSASKPRRKSLDPRDLLVSSPPWPMNGTPVPNGKEEDRESSSGDWVDKVMVNKHDLLSRDDNQLVNYEVENKLLFSEKFYQNHHRDPSKIYPEHPTNRLTASRKDNQDYDVQRSRSEIASTDESDLEAAVSDCSEPDSLWQCNIPKVSNIPSSVASKPKKSHLKAPTKSTETRSFIPSLIPSPPTRKLSNGVSPFLHKPGRQLSLVDGKRKTGHAKFRERAGEGMSNRQCSGCLEFLRW